MLHWFCYEMDSVLRSNVEWENVALKKHFMGLWVVVVAEVQRKYSSVQFSCSVVSDSVQHHRWQPTRLPRPWDSPGKNPGVGCHFLLQCMKVKEESEKVGLKLNIQKTKIMASDHISSVQFSRSVMSDSVTP